MYSKGKIYRIICDETKDEYIGSTIQSLSNRMSGHRSMYKRYLENKTNFTTSFNIIKYDSARIILIEMYPCETKDELEKREYYYMQQSNIKVN